MRPITLDDYYMTEQDEPTVVQLTGRPTSAARSSESSSASRDGTIRHTGRGMRRRIHLLRRAAGAALAA